MGQKVAQQQAYPVDGKIIPLRFQNLPTGIYDVIIFNGSHVSSNWFQSIFPYASTATIRLPLLSLPVVNSTLKRWKRGIMVIIACQNQELIPTFNYHNAAPMVLFWVVY